MSVLNLTIQIHEQIIETGFVLIMHSHTKLLHGFRRFEISVTWATCMILYIAFVSFLKLESFSFHSPYSKCTAKVQPCLSQSVIQFWNNMTVIKWWQNVLFYVNYPFKYRKSMWPLIKSSPQFCFKTISPSPSAICSLSVPQSVLLHHSILPSSFPNPAPLSFFFPFCHPPPPPPPPLCAHSLAVSNHSALIPAFQQPQECLNNVALSFNCCTGTRACVCACVCGHM